MSDLGTFLASAPIRQAYLERAQQNSQQPMQQIQQAGALQTLLAHAGAAQRDAQARQIIDSGAPPEQVFAALSKVSPEHAQKYAAGLKEMQALKMNELAQRALQGEDGTPQSDPTKLRKTAEALIASGHPGGAPLLAEAQRRQNEADRVAQLKEMRGTSAIAPDPQEVSQAADSGQQPPQTVPAKPGIGEDLLNSSDPSIAASAKNIRTQIANAGPSAKPEMYQQAINNLYLRQAAMDRARAAAADRAANRPEEPLVPILRNGKQVLVPRSEAKYATPASAASQDLPGDFSKNGEDFLKSLPETDRQLVKKIANYDIDPKTLSTKGGHREKMLSLVGQYDPTYDDTQYANKRRAISQFGSGPLGTLVRNQNVAIEHIDTLKRAGEALKNGNFTPGNEAYNEVAKVFGVTPPNTFEGIRDIVANEVIKGTIGNAGALQDRAGAAAKVKASSSMPQLNDLMNGWVELMGGQVKGLERQYEAATKNKDFRERFLTPRTRDAIAVAESKAQPAAPATVTAPAQDAGWTPEKEKRYQELLKKRGGS